MPDTFTTILFERHQGYAVLTLNRPDKLNSVTARMHDEIRMALDELDDDASLRCLLITGAGRAFCAGQDLSDRRPAPGDPPRDLGESLDTNYNPLVRRLRALERPVIAAVNGVAAGAGANLALACDLVLAGRSATFVQAFCRLGLVPDSGGTWMLPRLVGHARAAGLALLGDKLCASQAESWGLIWRVLDDDALQGEAHELAARLAHQPTRGLGLIKRALQASATQTLDQQLDLERDLQSIAGRTSDYREGVAAFLDKREPNFTGQ